jgi:hypothetical protein
MCDIYIYTCKSSESSMCVCVCVREREREKQRVALQHQYIQQDIKYGRLSDFARDNLVVVLEP